MATMKTILEAKGYTFFFVSPYDPVLKAATTLRERKVGALPVMDGERLVGIFSERDLVNLVAQSGGLKADTPVSEVMTSQVYGVKLGTTVDEAMALMTDRHIRHLPVVDNDLVVGIVSIGDIVKEMIRDQEIQIRGLEAYIAVRELPT